MASSQDILQLILDNPDVFGSKINERDLQTSKGKSSVIINTLDKVVNSKAFNKLSPYQKAATLTTLLQESTFGYDKNAKDNPAQITDTSLAQYAKADAAKEVNSKYKNAKWSDELQKKKDKEIDMLAKMKAIELGKKGVKNDPEFYVEYMHSGRPETLSSSMSNPANYGEEFSNAYPVYNIGGGYASDKLSPKERAAKTIENAKAAKQERAFRVERDLPMLSKQVEVFKELFPPVTSKVNNSLAELKQAVQEPQPLPDNEPKPMFHGQQLFSRD